MAATTNSTLFCVAMPCSCLNSFWSLKIEAVYSSKTSRSLRTVWNYVQPKRPSSSKFNLNYKTQKCFFVVSRCINRSVVYEIAVFRQSKKAARIYTFLFELLWMR
jgi:hypothetical protein